MKIDFQKDTVADIVRHDYRTARIFQEHQIDFCCGGGKTLATVCQQRKLDEATLRTALENASSSGFASNDDYDAWTLDRLADHIEETHHRYVERQLPVLKQYLQKLASVHGEGAPYLVDMAQIFEASAGNLAQHMKKEEIVLFPHIKRLVAMEQNGVSAEERSEAPFGHVRQPIAMMMVEHETEGEHFRQLESLSNGYEIPEWGCNTYAVAMRMLADFQEDLHLHIHLENNILFPKAAELEDRLMGN